MTSLLPGVTVQIRMHGTDFGAMLQQHCRCVTVDGCKWVLMHNSSSYISGQTMPTQGVGKKKNYTV